VTEATHGGLERWAKVAKVLTWTVVLAALVATCAWAVVTLRVRPLDGVEGEVLFEADRLRARLPLYTSPVIGAYDYGPVPARYLVLYPPLWPRLLALVPRAHAAVVARAVSGAAFLALLVAIVARAPKRRREGVLLVAAFVLGTWVLAFYAASGRPDALAVVLAGLAVERSARRASSRASAADPVVRLDFAVGVLFALAAWVKPNVLGMLPGAFLGALVASTARGARLGAGVRALAPAALGVLVTLAVVAGALGLASGRAWIVHLLASTGQPPSLALWKEQLASRAPFFAFPLLAALALGLRPPRDPGATIATFALASSLAWCVLCLAKIGSASNYFLEPCVAAVVVLARADLPRASPGAKLAFFTAAFVQAAWTGVASVKSSVEHVREAATRAAVLRDVRATCGAREADVVIADEPGLELMMNGRIVATPFQATHLARRGRTNVGGWLDDVARAEVKCLVMQSDLLERPLSDVSVDHDAFGPELRRALRAKFELAEGRGGYFVYRLRTQP